MSRRSLPISELAAGTHIISAVPCGLVSMILIGGTGTSTLKLYDHAATATGDVVKGLATELKISIVYAPVTPDAFATGMVAVVGGTGALAYLSIEPV